MVYVERYISEIEETVSFTSEVSAELKSWDGSDQKILQVARVSTGASGNEKADVGLMKRLMRDRHGSPFEHVSMTFLVSCPIFVTREFQRHRMASYNEESGRYRELKGKFYIPNEDRKIVQLGKPADYTYIEGDETQYSKMFAKLMHTSEDAYVAYKQMLRAGISREVARMSLPLNIFTTFYVTINARSLMNFLSLRKWEPTAVYPTGPMREIEMVAEAMSDAAKTVIPNTIQAFEEYGFVAP